MDTTQAALDLAPDAPIGSAEFAEVAWRAARPDDAAAIMHAVLDATPPVPAYDPHRSLSTLLLRTAEFDSAAAAGADPSQHSDLLADALKGITDGDTDLRSDLLAQVRARVIVRYLLRGNEPPAVLRIPVAGNRAPTAGPAGLSRHRADQLAAAAAELDAVSQRATATGAYLRIVAGLCDVGAELLRWDAAILEADTATLNAHAAAARRRTELA